MTDHNRQNQLVLHVHPIQLQLGNPDMALTSLKIGTLIASSML